MIRNVQDTSESFTLHIVREYIMHTRNNGDTMAWTYNVMSCPLKEENELKTYYNY